MQSQFDEVLREHIRRLLKIFPGAASLPFDLATITSLNLLLERDNEIEAFPESPTDRYTEDTLIEALTETGLDVDDHSRSAVQNLAQMGFVTINDEGKFIPRESTSRLVGVLDYLFPGFSGLNFVAYVLQTIDEAESGRKDPSFALDQFEQTLQKRGIPYSFKRAESSDTPEAPPKQLSRQQRKAYLQRLSQMRAQSASTGSNDAMVTAIPHAEVKVKTLFGKIPVEEPESSESEEESDESGPNHEQELEETDETAASEDSKIESEDTLQGLKSTAEPDTDSSESKEQTVPKQENDRPDFTTEATIPDSHRMNETSDRPGSEEYSVEERVEAFEESLAMACPVCEAGKIRISVTEKGKMYYVCDNEECNFITWGKPYHFSCLYCKNPFLVEFNTPKGVSGLKCPKASCGYRQNYIGRPLVNNQAGDSHLIPLTQENGKIAETPKRKKKIWVRKKFVRRKR